MSKTTTIPKAELAYLKAQVKSKSGVKGDPTAVGESYKEYVKKLPPAYKKAAASAVRAEVAKEVASHYVSDIRAAKVAAERETYLKGRDVDVPRPIQAGVGVIRRIMSAQDAAKERELQNLKAQFEKEKTQAQIDYLRQKQQQSMGGGQPNPLVWNRQPMYGYAPQQSGYQQGPAYQQPIDNKLWGSVPSLSKPTTYMGPADPLAMPNSGLGMPNPLSVPSLSLSLPPRRLMAWEQGSPMQQEQPVESQPSYVPQPQQYTYQQPQQFVNQLQPTVRVQSNKPVRPYVPSGQFTREKTGKAFYIRIKNPATGKMTIARARYNAEGQLEPVNPRYSQ